MIHGPCRSGCKTRPIDSMTIARAPQEPYVVKKGLPVDYVVFQDEGHGFVKKANQIKGYRAILDFLNSCLRNERGSSAPKTRRQSFPYGSAYVGSHSRQPAAENEPGC